MKVLRKVLIVLATIIVLLLVIALFIKKDTTIVRSIIINKPKQEVFDFVKKLKNQELYNKWVMTDPNAKKTYTGIDGTVGCGSSWDSEKKNVGKGEQTITTIAEGERLDIKIHFIKPFDNTANTFMTTETAGEKQTKLTWSFGCKTPYPMNIMHLFVNMDKMLGGDMDESLRNLSVLLEK